MTGTAGGAGYTHLSRTPALRSVAQNVRQKRSLENVRGVTAIELARQVTKTFQANGPFIRANGKRYVTLRNVLCY